MGQEKLGPSAPDDLPRPALVSVLPLHPALLPCCSHLLLDCSDPYRALFFAVANL